MKNKRYLLFILVAAIIVVAAIIFIISRHSSKASFTRYEWIGMLADSFNMKEYSEEIPYFKDVAPDDPYFAAVQAAYEWGVLENTAKFGGNKAITGEYAVITALKAVGQYRIKIYMGLSELPSDEDYIKLAIDKELIIDNDLKSNLSHDEAAAILDRAKVLYLGELWIDDYVDIKYTDNVIELDKKNIESYNSEDSIKVNNVLGIDSNSILVFPDEYTGGKIAKRVKTIDPDGTVILTETVLDDTIEHLVMSDIISLSTKDIIRNTVSTHNKIEAEKMGLFDDFSFHYDKPVHNSGAVFDIEIENNEAVISYKDNESGASGSITVPNIDIKDSEKNASDDSAFKCSFDLSKFDIGLMTDIGTSAEGLVINNIETQLDAQIDVLYEIGGNIETEIPLMKVPIYGERNVAGIELDIKLLISLDGSISLEIDCPSYALFEYRKGAKPRFDAGVEANIKDVLVNCTFEGKFRVAPTILILGFNITDVEMDIGGGASADIILRNSSDIISCADINFYAPTLGFGWNNDSDSILGEYIKASFIIFDSDNAPFKKNFHFEWYKNKPGKFVDVCTFGETGQRSEEDVDLDYSIPHQYYGEIHSEFKKKDGHLEATGKLISLALVSEDDFKSAAVGKSIECNGVNFTITKAGQDRDTNKKWFVLDNIYFIKEGNEDGGYSMAAGQEANKTYYRIETLSQDSLAELDDEEYFFPNGDKRVYIVIDDNFTFKTGDYYGGDVPKPSKGKWYYIQFSDGSSINDPNDVGRIYGFEEDTYGAVTDEGVIIVP